MESLLIITGVIVGVFVLAFALVYTGASRFIQDTAPPW